MTKLYGYDRMTMVICLIKGYIESTQSRIVIVIYKVLSELYKLVMNEYIYREKGNTSPARVIYVNNG